MHTNIYTYMNLLLPNEHIMGFYTRDFFLYIENLGFKLKRQL